MSDHASRVFEYSWIRSTHRNRRIGNHPSRNQAQRESWPYGISKLAADLKYHCQRRIRLRHKMAVNRPKLHLTEQESERETLYGQWKRAWRNGWLLKRIALNGMSGLVANSTTSAGCHKKQMVQHVPRKAPLGLPCDQCGPHGSGYCYYCRLSRPAKQRTQACSLAEHKPDPSQLADKARRSTVGLKVTTPGSPARERTMNAEEAWRSAIPIMVEAVWKKKLDYCIEVEFHRGRQEWQPEVRSWNLRIAKEGEQVEAETAFSDRAPGFLSCRPVTWASLKLHRGVGGGSGHYGRDTTPSSSMAIRLNPIGIASQLLLLKDCRLALPALGRPLNWQMTGQSNRNE